jgi:transposase-like protein
MKRCQFTREFKLEAVRLIKDRGVSFAQADDLGVHPLRDWGRLVRVHRWFARRTCVKNTALFDKRELCPQSAPKGKLLSSHERVVFT